MTKPANDKPTRRKANSTPYATAWFILGAAGLGYLGVAFFAPHLLPDLSGGRNPERLAETAVMKMSSEVDGLKTSLTQLQLDLASVKADAVAQASQTQSLSTQLTALDDKVRLGQQQTSASNDASSQAAPNIPAFASGASEAEAADPGPAPAKIINGEPKVGAPIETGSVNRPAKASAAPAISFGPAIVKPTPKPVGIQLATDPSVDGLRITWSALAQTHSDQLGKLRARYADLGTASNPNFGLIAGPVKSKSEAKKLCKALSAQSVSCKVSEFRGEEL
jgi:hypothetical protein